eukprot:5904863-Pyramimonas_sp.AAC.1
MNPYFERTMGQNRLHIPPGVRTTRKGEEGRSECFFRKETRCCALYVVQIYDVPSMWCSLRGPLQAVKQV